jgi:hypothetical protein
MKSIAVREDLYDKAAAMAANDRLASQEYIGSRAQLFNRDEFERALNEIPDAEPDDCDRM